jgi:hypothetical protein
MSSMIMHRSVRACVAVAALAVSALLPRVVLAKSAPLTFFAVMNGGQVVPPSPSNAMGVAFLTFDNATKRLCFSISYSALQGTETEAHLHSAQAGATNAVLYDLTPLGTPKIGCLGPIKPVEEKALRRGRLYINIHTDVYVAGEIRGQVLPVPAAR